MTISQLHFKILYAGVQYGEDGWIPELSWIKQWKSTSLFLVYTSEAYNASSMQLTYNSVYYKII